MALLPHATPVRDGTAGRRRAPRLSITWLPRSPFAEDVGAGQIKGRLTRRRRQRERGTRNEDAFTEAVSTSHPARALIAVFRTVAAGFAGFSFVGFVANGEAGVSLNSTPAPVLLDPAFGGGGGICMTTGS